MPLLTIEMIPSSTSFTNVRSLLSIEKWNKIRRFIYKRAKYKCEICRGKGEKHPIECHEVWQYKEDTHVQRLIGLIGLCPDCHTVKHIGRSIMIRKKTRCIKHLAHINQWSIRKATQYVEDCFCLMEKKNKHKWTVDITLVLRKDIWILYTQGMLNG